MGKNWNSKKGKFVEIKSQEIKDLADKAKRLKAKGYSVAKIAEEFGLSKGRIYEYLKQDLYVYSELLINQIKRDQVLNLSNYKVNTRVIG